MLPQKVEIGTFYEKLREMFSALKELPFWTEWHDGNDGYVNTMVMSHLATELIGWATNGNWSDVKTFLNEIEEGFINGDDTVVTFLGTDFTVTILECRNISVREKIKELMGIVTRDAYQINLGGYNERN